MCACAQHAGSHADRVSCITLLRSHQEFVVCCLSYADIDICNFHVYYHYTYAADIAVVLVDNHAGMLCLVVVVEQTRHVQGMRTLHMYMWCVAATLGALEGGRWHDTSCFCTHQGVGHMISNRRFFRHIVNAGWLAQVMHPAVWHWPLKQALDEHMCASVASPPSYLFCMPFTLLAAL